MSASITSSPTLIDHPHDFDDFDPNHRDFRLFDTSDRIDFSTPPAPLLPPPYPESLLFSDDDDDDDETNFSPRSRTSGFHNDQDGEHTPRPGSPTTESMRTRLSLLNQRSRPTPGLLYTHIAHGAIHDAVVERFNPPACHPETHRAIVDDVMSWIQYIPPPPPAGAEPPLPSTPTTPYASATFSFYGPHTRNNINRNRSPSTAIPPSQPEHILWLTGPTSSGKSSLMHTIAERCVNTHIANPTTGGPPLPLLAASFFFRYHRSPRNNKSKFVTTLAYQLARNVPGLGELVERVIERHLGILSLGEPEARGGSGDGRPSNGLATQMEKLVLEPLAQLVQIQQAGSATRRNVTPTPRVILIEALDECINDEDQLEILHLVRKLSQDRRFVPYFRLVISSKPHRTIERHFKIHPELDLVTYRLDLPFAANSSGEVPSGGSGRGRGRGGGGSALSHDSDTASPDMERDCRLYLECKFNEMCRNWYGLPRNVGWPNASDSDNGSSKETVIDRLVHNTAGKFPYALTVIRFILQGDASSETSKLNPKRLLDLVLHAKFTKSYQNPLAALDALYTVIIHEAAERSGFKEASRLARAVREIDELLSAGTGIELTLPRLALFFGFGAGAGHSGEEAKCLEAALVGGLLNAILEVPAPIEEATGFRATFRRAHMNDNTTLRRVVKFHDRSFVEFLRDPSRSKGLYVSRSQLYTDLAVRYLRTASSQHSLQPMGSKANTAVSRKSGKGLQSMTSSTSSFSATQDTTDGHERHHYPEMPFSAPANITSFRHTHPYPTPPTPQSPYAIDADDASLFLSQLHLGKFCSFSVVDDPGLVKELIEFDVDLWLFGMTASFELASGGNGTDQLPTSSQSPLALPLGTRGGAMRGGDHRRVMSEAPTRSSMFAPVPEDEGLREKERKRTEALMRLHGNTSISVTSAGPESDIDAMYRWVHVECSWSSCTPVCRRWRRAIVKFWQREGAPQQPTVMDRIYDKFMPRDTKRVKLITSRYRL